MYESRIATVVKLTDMTRFGAQGLSIDSIPFTPHMMSGMSSQSSTRKICRLSI